MAGLLWGDNDVVRLSLDCGGFWDERLSGEKAWRKYRKPEKGGHWDGTYNGVTPMKLKSGRL